MKVIQLYKQESELIKRALKNNREAQHVLFEMHAPKMLSVCRYYIKDLQQAEEAMLNGFFKVFTQLKTFRNEGSFEGWIRRIMVRESLSYLRSKRSFEQLEDHVSELADVEYLETSLVESQWNASDIQQLIDSLPDGYRAVFVMYAIEGYKHHEIAELLNISEGTSKSQLFKARKLLQQQIVKLKSIENGTH
ncbi:MAG: RNA polymerase sigma factor [Flavobacteriaceae bacterium]|nr:RNA polymerase sigma factor [Mangrovimonas sp.]MCB0431968.1 RNA polymerase sigma factor [Mangrovimonas sp.]HPF97604.1 RNA polymerase sigma factor [Mangrovimonas sp.]